jgi:hypothetical protein
MGYLWWKKGNNVITVYDNDFRIDYQYSLLGKPSLPTLASLLIRLLSIKHKNLCLAL